MESTPLTMEDLEQIRNHLAARPPDAVFTAAEAAIYTGRSTRTLKRAIDAGMGPRREKNPDVSGLGATNRHTRYRKADLDAWRDRLVGFATNFRNFDDLAADAPWVVKDDRIIGHLLDLPDIETTLRVLGNDALIFLRLDEALGQEWTSGARSAYQKAFEFVSRLAIQAAGDMRLRDAMEDETGPALGHSRPPLRM